MYAVTYIGIAVVRSNACRDFPLYAVTHIRIFIVRSNAYRAVRGFGLGIFPAGGGPGSAFGMGI